MLTQSTLSLLYCASMLAALQPSSALHKVITNIEYKDKDSYDK